MVGGVHLGELDQRDPKGPDVRLKRGRMGFGRREGKMGRGRRVGGEGRSWGVRVGEGRKL